MEMKHLGSTLRVAAYVKPLVCVCVCVCIRVSAPVCARKACIYMTRRGPGGGRRCLVKVTMRGRRGGRGHLLAGSSKMRVTAIHLSESTLIQDPICPPPLGHFSPSPSLPIPPPPPPPPSGEPLTLAVALLTGPPVLTPCRRVKRRLLTSTQRPFRATGVQENPPGTRGPAAVCRFTGLGRFSSSFKAIRAPQGLTCQTQLEARWCG